MEKHSKISVIAFTLSMLLFGIFILAVTITIVSIHYKVLGHSGIVTRLLGHAILIYAGGFLAALWLNINAFYQRDRSKILPILGLSSQVLILFAVFFAIWLQFRPPIVCSASIIEYGEYHATVMDSTITDDSTHSKFTFFKDILLMNKADTIRASIGKTFGFRYVIYGYPPRKKTTIKVVYLSPSSGNTDQKLQTVMKSTYKIQSYTLGDTAWTCFTFDDDEDLIPGSWGFQVWSKDRKLAEKVFVVIDK